MNYHVVNFRGEKGFTPLEIYFKTLMAEVYLLEILDEKITNKKI